MSRYALSAAFIALAGVSSVFAQLDPAVTKPLAEKVIPYDQIVRFYFAVTILNALIL